MAGPRNGWMIQADLLLTAQAWMEGRSDERRMTRGRGVDDLALNHASILHRAYQLQQ